MQIITCPTYFDDDKNTNQIRLAHRSVLPKIKNNKQLSISLWLYCTRDWFDDSINDRTILYKGNDTTFWKLYMSTYSNHIHFATTSFENTMIVTSSIDPIPLYTWAHLLITIDDNHVNMFVNGVLSNSSVNQLDMNSYPFYIGSDCNKKHLFIGFLDQLIIQRELISLDVDSLMETKPSYPPAVFTSELKVKSKPIISMKHLDQWTPGIDPINVCTVPLQPRPYESKRKVLHCHDMKGGYLSHSDELSRGGTEFCVYNFQYWQYLDYFIYFSHNRVTIPPPGWIEAAHKNGVKCFATFITEWAPGEKECIILLDGPTDQSQSPDTFSKFYADKLIDMAQYYGFDGWFFNIENPLPQGYVTKMINFLDYMTREMHRRIPGSLVMWYDSVTIDGELKWQNALNEKNKVFFDVCDSIFLNYCWNPKTLPDTVAISEGRAHDIFTGIDIFGRNTYGGGGFTTHVALQEIEACGTSTALFAPGWTFESSVGDAKASSEILRKKFEAQDDKFWTGKDQIQLLVNPSGENGLDGWEITENGGDGWKVSDGGLSGKCFVTSYKYCRKKQVIDLSQHDCFQNGSLPLTIHCSVR
jgi:hypothetical protein